MFAAFISSSNPQVCVSTEKVILRPVFGQICSAELAATSNKDNAYLLACVCVPVRHFVLSSVCLLLFTLSSFSCWAFTWHRLTSLHFVCFSLILMVFDHLLCGSCLFSQTAFLLFSHCSPLPFLLPLCSPPPPPVLSNPVTAGWSCGTMCQAWPRVFLDGSWPSRAEPPASHDCPFSAHQSSPPLVPF